PEAIAVMKLRGFVQDAGGRIMESEPGKIRVQVGDRPAHTSTTGSGRSLFGWLGGRVPAAGPSGKAPPDPIEMLLFMTRKDPTKANCLELTVVLKPLDGLSLAYPFDWRPRCHKLLNDMRAYLMAK